MKGRLRKGRKKLQIYQDKAIVPGETEGERERERDVVKVESRGSQTRPRDIDSR